MSGSVTDDSAIFVATIISLLSLYFSLNMSYYYSNDNAPCNGSILILSLNYDISYISLNV